MSVFQTAYSQSASTGFLTVSGLLPRETKRHKVTISVKTSRGADDPDDSQVFFRVILADDSEFGAGRLYDSPTGGAKLGDSGDSDFPHAAQHWVVQPTKVRTGTYEAWIDIQATDTTEPDLTVEAAWKEQGRPYSLTTKTRIGDAADQDDIASDASDAKDAAEANQVNIEGSSGLAAIKSVVDLGATASALQTVDDELAVVDGVVDAIKTETDKLGSPAGASHAADVAAVKAQTAAIETDTQSIETKVDTVDGNVDAILVDTGTTLPDTLGSPAGASVSADVASVKADTGTNLPTLIASLATKQIAIEGKVDTVDGVVDAILVDTADMQPKLGSPAGASLAADIAAVKTVVDAGATATALASHDSVLSALISPIGSAATDSAAALVDIGDFSSETNLQSVLEYLGSFVDDSAVPLDYQHRLQLYGVGGTPAAGTFTLTQISGGMYLSGDDSNYAWSIFMVVAGPNAGTFALATAYNGTTKLLTHSGGTLSTSDVIAFEIPPSMREQLIGGVSDRTLADGTLALSVSNLIKGTVGDPSDDTTFQTIAAKLGESDDASSSTGSVMARLAKVIADIAAVAAGSGTQTTEYDWFPVNGNTVLSANPTEVTEAQDTQADADTWEVMSVWEHDLAEGTAATIRQVQLSLAASFTGAINAGAGSGDVKWMISPTSVTETPGSAPNGAAVNISAEIPVTTTPSGKHVVSGLLPDDAITAITTAGGFNLILAGKLDTATDTISASIYNESYLRPRYDL